jgi:putative nucleotidyltransferase with HDIG domain
MRPQIVRRLEQVNKELWLLLMVFSIAAGLNYALASNRILLSFYVLPSVFSAYFYGRRHATLTALASVLLVVLMAYWNLGLFAHAGSIILRGEKWYDIGVWGGTLIITAYAMGTLYEGREARLHELRESYNGILLILRQFISNDKYTQNHSYRVSVYASRIAEALGLKPDRIEDIRDAALLHDIGKLAIPRKLLYKAARLTAEEYDEIQKHVELGLERLEAVGGSLHRVIPIVLAHHDKFDGTGYHQARGEDIPLEARVIAVADIYDALVSDRPYRKAMPPPDAKEIIAKGSGTDFDPDVVKAFLDVYQRGAMEVPDLYI